MRCLDFEDFHRTEGIFTPDYLEEILFFWSSLKTNKLV